MCIFNESMHYAKYAVQSMHGTKNLCIFNESMHYAIYRCSMHSMHGIKNMCLLNECMYYALYALYAWYMCIFFDTLLLSINPTH